MFVILMVYSHISFSVIQYYVLLFNRWGKRAAHNRAQIVYYMAENLELRREEVAKEMSQMTGHSLEYSQLEVDLAIQRLFYWGAYADKFGGTVQVCVWDG